MDLEWMDFAFKKNFFFLFFFLSVIIFVSEI